MCQLPNKGQVSPIAILNAERNPSSGKLIIKVKFKTTSPEETSNIETDSNYSQTRKRVLHMDWNKYGKGLWP